MGASEELCKHRLGEDRILIQSPKSYRICYKNNNAILWIR